MTTYDAWADLRAAIRDAATEVRTYVADRPLEFRAGYLAAFIVGASLIATPDALWGWALFIDTAAIAAGLLAWALDLRAERDSARATVRELNTEATRLHMLLTEAEIAALVDMPARLWAVPEQRTGAHDDIPNADDAIWLNLYDENGQHR